MSIADWQNRKVILPRRSEALGGQVAESLAAFRPSTSAREVHDGLKMGAVLCLYSMCGWSLDQIGLLFGHPKGHVTRIREFAAKTIRATLQLNPTTDTYAEDLADAEAAGRTEEVHLVQQFISLDFHQKRAALAAVLDGGDRE